MQKKIGYKKFLKYFIFILIIFVMYHLEIWYFYTSKIFSRDDNLYIGDLGRISYQINSLHPRKLEHTLSKKLLNYNNTNNQKIDIITVGDSFSNAGSGGLNPYYQDYLGTLYNKNILNIIKLTDNKHRPFELIITLYNNGWLKEHKPEMIIIQSIERLVHSRFSKKFDFSSEYFNTKSITTEYKTNNLDTPKLSFISIANYKFISNMITFDIRNKKNKNIAKVTLNKNLFSPKNYQNKLLFYFDDVKNINNDVESIKLINYNFNKLSSLLKILDIKLVFMPSVDKYDLYSDFITNNHYPINNFFDTIRPLKKEYYFIDTKAILIPLLKQNIKDVFYADDTHWSYKASETITKCKVFRNNL